MGIVTDAEFRRLNPPRIVGGVRFWVGRYGFGHTSNHRPPFGLLPTVWRRDGRVWSAPTWPQVVGVMYRRWRDAR